MREQFRPAGGEGFLMGQCVFTEGSSLDLTLYPFGKQVPVYLDVVASPH